MSSYMCYWCCTAPHKRALCNVPGATAHTAGTTGLSRSSQFQHLCLCNVPGALSIAFHSCTAVSPIHEASVPSLQSELQPSPSKSCQLANHSSKGELFMVSCKPVKVWEQGLPPTPAPSTRACLDAGCCEQKFGGHTVTETHALWRFYAGYRCCTASNEKHNVACSMFTHTISTESANNPHYR
jgi:hypothetical protein